MVRSERSPLVSTKDQIFDNVIRLHAMATGTPEERAFHRSRVKNARVLVAVETEEGLIYAPSKFSGYRENGVHHADLLEERHGSTTNIYISRLLGEPHARGSPDFQKLEQGYRQYCARFGFAPSKREASARYWLIREGISPFPDDIPNGQSFPEGAGKIVTVNRYERDRRARQLCIAHYGTSCSVCEFNFEEVYGDIGQDFIHVHHIVPLATVGKAYLVDPIEDLRPVCPNFHAMLHRNGDLISIDGLRNILNKY